MKEGKNYFRVLALLGLAIGALVFPPRSFAVPASPEVHVLAQPDGATFNALQWGDENRHGWETEDGYTIVFEEMMNRWTYARQSLSGNLVGTSFIAGKDAPPADLKKTMRPLNPPAVKKMLSKEKSFTLSGALSPQGTSGPELVVAPAGSANVPVVLVNFTDRLTTFTPAQFNDMLFGTGNYSFADYYKEVSYNKFSVAPGPSSLAQWYTASGTHNSYGPETQWPILAKEAAVLAKNAGFDFTVYDSDGDCKVDVLAVIHQGPGQEATGNVNDIWSHRYSFSDAGIGPYDTGQTCSANPAQHVIVDDYIIMPEKYGTGISTMGVFAHEYGHSFGLPDLYDTDYTSEGIGRWSLMAAGTWNMTARPGDRPAHMDAWCKYALGWVTPTKVTTPLTNQPIIAASAAADVYQFLNGTAPILSNSVQGTDEYFLVENRQKSGFDAGLPGTGLLIWHIDESMQTNDCAVFPINIYGTWYWFDENTILGNPYCIPPKHYHVALVQADNRYQLEGGACYISGGNIYCSRNRGDAGDPFPGSTYKRWFFDTSHQFNNSNLYGGVTSNVIVADISDSGPIMTASMTAQPLDYTVPLADALDNPALNAAPLDFTGSTWRGQSLVTFSGGSAAQSGLITNGQYAELVTTITGTASLSFSWKVSSEPLYDYLKLTIDGIEKARISGETKWLQRWFSINGPNAHTIKWTYYKNGSGSKGMDAGWVDKVVVSPNTALTVTGPGKGAIVQAGSTANISWNAPATAEKYVLFYSLNGTTWIPIPDPKAQTPLPQIGDNFTTITYSWTVPVPATGNVATAKIKVVAYNGLNAIVGTAISAAPFTIQVLKVTTPNGGGQPVNPKLNPLSIGYTIYGQDQAANAVVSYSITGGTSWVKIGDTGPLAPGAHAYSWAVPAQTALKTTCKVKVDLKSNAGVLLATDMSDANFSILPFYSISGVVTQNGKALSGVTVNLGGADTAQTVTDVSGKYVFKNLLAGNFAVSAVKSGFVFNPTSKIVAVTTSNFTTANFAGTPFADSGYALSGMVSGASVTGVTLTLSGTLNGAVQTDADGKYFFGNLAIGYYSIIPSKPGYTFNPASFGHGLNVPWSPDSDAAKVDFTATAGNAATYSISGKVTFNGVGLRGALIAVSGAAGSAQVVTDLLGNYTVKGLKSGAYDISPNMSGYNFTPGTVRKTLSTNLTAVNFAAAGSTHSISGRILLKNNNPADGVTVTLNSSPLRTAVTNTLGYYMFTNVPNGIYTMTPTAPINYSALFLPPNRMATVDNADASDQNFGVNVLFNISGTVVYTGTKTGKIYLDLFYEGGGNSGRGTSIATPGAFTIRGVEPGNYIVNAYRDTLGVGRRNTTNPIGMAAVTVDYDHKTGVKVTLVNPPAPASKPEAPGDLYVVNGNSSAFILWDTISNNQGIEDATAYKIYWYSDNTVSNQIGHFTGVQTVSARDDAHFMHSGLVDGTVLYYVVTAVNSVGESSASEVFGPVTIGQPVGGSTVSGKISFTPAAAALYVGLYNEEMGILFNRIASAATSPQNYSVTGVPDGVWYPFAFIDINKNGIMDLGDVVNTENLAPPVTVSGNTSKDLVLGSVNAFAMVGTNHRQQNSFENYGMDLSVIGVKNLPIKVTLMSGPNVPVPIDMGKGWGEFNTWIDLGSTRPVAGDAYTFSITYVNGVVETLTAPVTAVLDSFAGNMNVSTGLTPTFTWEAPVSPPDDYGYSLKVLDSNWNWMWEYPRDNNLPSSQTSAVYNVDDSAFPKTLSNGQAYSWELEVRDNNRNSATMGAEFTVFSNDPIYSISGNVSGAISDGVTMTLSGNGITPVNTTTAGGGNYSFTSLAPGTYTVTPSLGGYSFVLANQSVNVVSADITGVNFTSISGGGSTYTLSGTVSLNVGGTLQNVTMNLSGLGSTVTNASGYYAFSGLPNGDYTVTPSLSGYTFNPQAQYVTISGSNYVAGFTATSTTPPPSVVSISGTINYSGAKTGRVYINVEGMGRGTSIAAPGAFTIRGIQPGSYNLTAFMDTMGTGKQNASNPTGNMSNVNGSGGNVTGVSLTLSDPAPVTPAKPTGLKVTPGNGSAFIGWDVSYDNNGIETATSYDVYSKSTDSTCDVTTLLYDSMVNFVARDDSGYFQSGLVNGTKICYLVTAIGEGGTSAPSEVFGPITIGAPVGGSTVSGVITAPSVTTSGPLIVGAYSDTAGIYFTPIYSVSTSQTYTITGLPDGAWHLFAFIDQDNNGVIEVGEVSNTEDLSPLLTLNSGPTTTIRNLALSAVNAVALVTTSHGKNEGVDWYSLFFEVRDGMKLPVKVAVSAGPNIDAPLDIPRQGWSTYGWASTNENTRPLSGQTYTFGVTYSDGSTATLTPQVSGVLDAFAGNLAVSSGLTPTFSWTAPVSPPANYTYRIQVQGPGVWWQYPQDGGMPSSQTSVQYNNAPALTPGEIYGLSVTLEDESTGNNTMSNIQFMASAAAGGYSISGTVTNLDNGSGPTLVCVTTDAAFPMPCPYGAVANSGSYTVTGIPNGTYYVGAIQDRDYDSIPDSNEPQGVFGAPDQVMVNNANRTNINFTIAIISAPTYTLTVSKVGAGSGRVSAPGGLDCGSTCSKSMNGSVDLTAFPDSGSVFAGWSGNCTPNNQDGTSCTVTVDSAKTVTATFNVVFNPLKWSLALNGGPIYYSSPAIGSDGTIYVGSGGDGGDQGVKRGLYAVNPNGTLKWEYTDVLAAMPKMYTPSISPDGTIIYVQDWYSSLYAIYANNGTLKWKHTFATTGNVGQTAPAIAADGTIYVGADRLYAIDPADGSIKWFSNYNGFVRSSPAIGSDGTIYVGMNDMFKALVAINPATGATIWDYTLPGAEWVFSSPAIGADGTIYIGGETSGDLSYVYAVNPNGTPKWRYDVSGGRTVRSSPAIGVDGTIYIGTKASVSTNADFLALNPNGTLKWNYTIDQAMADIYGSPTVGADGLIYFGAETSNLYAMNPDGTLAWKYATNNGVNWTSPAIADDGTIYIGNNDGKLFALNSTSMGLAGSSWPKFRHDNKNKGRFESYSISGTITNDNPVSGNTLVCVTMDSTFSSACTYSAIASSGTYTVTNVASGTYYVGAIQDVDGDLNRDAGEPQGVYGAPDQVTVNSGDVTGINFSIAIPVIPTYTISGTMSGAVTDGVTMTLSGGASASTLTSGGTYSFPNLVAGSYVVTPSYPGSYSFSPSYHSVDITSADQTGIDFTSSTTHSISGTVTNYNPMNGNTLVCVTTDQTFLTCNYGAIAAGNGTYTVTSVATGTYYVGADQDMNADGLPSLDEPHGVYATQVAVSSADRSNIDINIALPVYSVSGTVTRASSKTGRAYLTLGNEGRGTNANLASGTTSTSFSIRGVPPGTYTLSGFLDNLGKGRKNASNPVGSVNNVQVTTANVTGVVVNLTDPVQVTPVTPTGLFANPGNESAFIGWDAVYDNYLESAQTYSLYWKKTATTCDNAATLISSPDGVVSLAAMDDAHYFQSALFDGDKYCYVITATGESGASGPSAVVGPITIGAVSGLNTVSGIVSVVSNTVTGPLYVGLYSDASGVYMTQIASPQSSQTYSVSGLPDDTWHVFAFVDNNNNGVMDIGDVANTENLAPPIVISGNNSVTQDISLVAVNTYVRVTTQHMQTGASDSYMLNFETTRGMKLPIKTIVTGGPNFTPNVDMGNNGRSYSARLGNIALPVSGQTYTVKVVYSDNTSEFINPQVTGVLNSFATPAYPLGTVTGDTTPTFAWDAPASPPLSYGYYMYISPDGGGQGWMYPQNQVLPSSTVSFPYSATGQPALTGGTKYWWTITVYDNATGNSCGKQVDFTP